MSRGDGQLDPRSAPDRHRVPITLPAEHLAILRSDLSGGLHGASEDLETPEKLLNPERRQLEATVFERLLAGFDRGEILLPDEDARGVIARMAAGFDDASDYEVISATHDAHYGLLALLERVRRP
jgi:hypothetical protein